MKTIKDLCSFMIFEGYTPRSKSVAQEVENRFGEKDRLLAEAEHQIKVLERALGNKIKLANSLIDHPDLASHFLSLELCAERAHSIQQAEAELEKEGGE